MTQAEGARIGRSVLFTPWAARGVALANRFVMPAMQRGACAAGAPLPALADYYRRRVQGGVGLIIGESCAIDHPSATCQPAAARMAADTQAAWAHCVAGVRDAGGHLLIQLWHEGALRRADDGGTISPSGLARPGQDNGRAATLAELVELREAYATAARRAQDIGAAGVEVHCAHGYLLDQFLWAGTNRREDGYGGDVMADRLRFPAEVVAAVRAACGPDFLISLRFSQWKEVDYTARIAPTPDDLALLATTFEVAGVDVFHASTRRFWTPEWEGDPRGLAGWLKAFTRKPVIAVGSAGLDIDVMATFTGSDEPRPRVAETMAEAERRMAAGEFDLLAVGRALIGDPDFVAKVGEGRDGDVRGFVRADLGQMEWDADIVEGAHHE
ncbi:12-oxophytodienoate reductase [Novosphingobium sp. FSY-8]|uniref:12-oxophytodienoate reductase n=1 Tax=Novosphingobium ovatum TaxID=1908523 RepID=A0ABW9XA69_9SPHN|nr:12-oxophytodienoate reductase [Novosphingobium ovatum]NBC35427.1 12-oxophytodienoate reductase [Novosphingobium ovatum]